MRRSTRPLLAAILALLLFVLGACGGDGDDGAAEGGSGTEATSEDAGGAGDDDAGRGVEVLDEGKEPRRELRFAFTEGQEFRTRMTMTLGMEMSIDGQALPTPPNPPMEIVMAGKVDAVKGDVATYSFTYERVGLVRTEGVDPAMAAQIEAGLQQMQGLRGTGTVDVHGNAGEGTLDTSSVADPTLKTTLDSITSQISNLAVPLPTKAVGVGARWKADRRAVLNGITTDTAMTYTLRSLDGDRYVLDVVQAVTAPAGAVDIPGLGAGKAEIVSYDAENQGEVVGDLAKVLPTSSDIAGGGDIVMKVDDGTQTVEVVQKLKLQITIAPA